MAEVSTQRAPRLKFNPIIKESIKPQSSKQLVAFDHEKHLAFHDEPNILTMKDLHLPEDLGISPVAVSEPFPLFNEEAIHIMREEILQDEVWENCMYSSEQASCQLRGYCPRYAPFIYNAWKDPRTLSIVSKIAGIDLVPVMDLDIGNINVAVQNGGDNLAKMTNQSIEDIPVTHWHRDSYSFVCVVMMSDAKDMVGGETALQTGNGEITKVRGPQMGCAVVLQGRCIMHQALAAIGGAERITMVTSFRPRDPLIHDSSVLTTVRPITEPSMLYFQWTQYRMKVLQDRIQQMLTVMEEQYAVNRTTDVKKIKKFLEEQEEWLLRTNREIMES